MGELTRIYSHSRDTINGLTIYAEDEGENGNYSNLVWFPEIKYKRGMATMPVHPADLIELCPELVGKMVVTLSEHIILWFLREIGEGHMEPHEVELYCGGHRIRIDVDGELIDKWPGGFFRERADLLFY